MSLWRWLVICFCLGAVVGCDSFQATPCGESSRNLTLPYAYAAAYVVVTTDDHHPKISKNTEKSAGPDILAPVKTPSVITTQTAGDDAAGDATEVAAPPAAEPPKVVLYGYTGCEGCKWSHDQFTKEKIPHEYIIVKPVAGVEYPYAEIDGKKLSYLEIQDWLKSRKENP
jgi:hypothetical protein